MNLHFDNLGRDRVSLDVAIDVDYRDAPEKFERTLRRELRRRDCTLPVSLAVDCMATTPDGSEGIVFAGLHRMGEWRRVAV